MKLLLIAAILLLFVEGAAQTPGEGLTGRYYQGWSIDSLGYISFEGLNEAFSRIDSTIDFWNGSRFYRWQPLAGWNDNFSVGWSGFIFIEQGGEYGFGTMSDDGSQIFIDDSLIVDNSESQWYDWEDNVGEGDTSGTPFLPFVLDSGFHAISVRFYEKGVYEGIELWWLKPGSGVSDIPYYGTNFHGIPPTFNANTNWELVPTAVMYPAIPVSIAGDFPIPPEKLTLHQNYPNPFNGATTIEFSLANPATVRLQIFDIQGKLIKTLIDNRLGSGTHQSHWQGQDHADNSVASGVYFYQITAGRYKLTRKLLFLK